MVILKKIRENGNLKKNRENKMHFYSIFSPLCDDETEFVPEAEEQEEDPTIEIIETTPNNEIFRQMTDPLACHICLKKFKKKYDLNHHIMAHTGDKPHKCAKCGKEFIQKSNLKRHSKTHRVYQNKVNPVVEKNDFEIVTDIGRKMAIKSVKSLKCGFCTEIFTSMLDLKSHNAVNHASEKIFNCGFCEIQMQFDNFKEYSDHLNILHNEKPKPFCDMCQIDFETEEKLAEHLEKIKHKITCDGCGKIFSIEKYLKQHQQKSSCNLTEKQYECSVCLKKYFSEYGLRRHLLTHENLYPFKCDHCEKCFKRRDNLKRHQKMHMESPKIFPCPFPDCSKQFYRNDKLKDHLGTHGK